MTTSTIESPVTVGVEATDWQVAMASGNRSVRLRGLSPQMLTDEGEVITSNDGDVRFDETFVYYVLTERFLKPLGLVAPDGSVKERFITNTLIPAAIEYAKKENEREAAQRRLELATQMARFNGRSVAENIELLEAKENIEL